MHRSFADLDKAGVCHGKQKIKIATREFRSE